MMDDRTGIKGTLKAICVSERRGTLKEEVPCAVLRENFGIEGDAHAGQWHRQVSLLSFEKIEEFRSRGADVGFGAFGENLIISGIDLRALPVDTELKIGETLLRVSQIGKACHSHCEIYKKTGDCIMPREGIFAEVEAGGIIRPGDAVEVLPLDPDRPFTAAVITLSDRAAAGEYEDKSGPEIERILRERYYRVLETLLLPDDKSRLMKELMRLADQRQVNVIFTTGGTGFSERDQTPEATIAVCDRMAPGIAEAMRAESMRITPKGMLSRAVSGIRKKTLIVNLPGSPKACRECLDVILDPLDHGLGILRGSDTD